MGMPVETMTESVDGAENADIHPASAGRSERLTSTAATANRAGLRLGVFSRRAGDELSGNPDIGGLFPAGGASTTVAGVGNVFYMRQAELSPPYSFTPVMKVSQASILVTASTSISRRPRTSRNEVRYWLAVNSFLSGRGVKPESMKQIKLLLSADGRARRCCSCAPA